MPDQMVILIRHAEKSKLPPDDPALTEFGLKQAKNLRKVLADANVTSILTSQWRRTRDTAKPLAEFLNIEPVVFTSKAGAAVEDHINEMVAHIRREQDAVTLVVGHSNTVPLIIQALGGAKIEQIKDDEYDYLFLLNIKSDQTQLVRARY
jgi:broad specificity phosphatase PhoE